MVEMEEGREALPAQGVIFDKKPSICDLAYCSTRIFLIGK
jgi:hypothetical protein